MKNQNSLKWIIKNSKYITGIGGNCFGTCK